MISDNGGVKLLFMRDVIILRVMHFHKYLKSYFVHLKLGKFLEKLYCKLKENDEVFMKKISLLRRKYNF